jgi:hypothetical protein
MADVKSLRFNDIELMKGRLWQAAREGRVEDVRQLSIYFCGDVDTLGETLNWACIEGRLNVITWLVENNVARNDGKRLGMALVSACKHTNWNIVKWLVKNTLVDVNYVDFESKNSILHRIISFNIDNLLTHYSTIHNRTEMCRRVYVRGEDVNVQNNDGCTPLHRATFYENADSVGALLLAGADETVTNDEGLTPVQWAVKSSSVNVLPLLDVSNKWKLLIRSHRLRRRTAVRVMMALVKLKVQQTSSAWTRAIMTYQTIMTCAVFRPTCTDTYECLYTPRMHKYRKLKN